MQNNVVGIVDGNESSSCTPFASFDLYPLKGNTTGSDAPQPYFNQDAPVVQPALCIDQQFLPCKQANRF